MFKGGGVQEGVLAIQKELKARGHIAKIITPAPKGVLNPVLEDTLFVGVATDVKSPFHTTAQVSVSLDNESLDKILNTEKFDILHFHEPWVPMLSRQILSRSTAVNVATFHAKLPETMMAKTIEKVVTPYTRSIMKYLHGLTAVSNAAAEYVRTLAIQDISIIPNGIDLAHYGKPTAMESENLILYIGRLEKRKGVKYLLKAYQSLAERDNAVELIIAGDGNDRVKLEQFVKEQKIPRVKFLGFVDQETKLKLLSQARVFVSPALYGESFGIVLLEAMASGVPIVAGDNAGYRAVMQETGEISLVNPKDADDFSRRLYMFLRNDALRKTWIEWADEYVRQFSYPKIVSQYERLYEQLIDEAKK